MLRGLLLNMLLLNMWSQVVTKHVATWYYGTCCYKTCFYMQLLDYFCCVSDSLVKAMPRRCTVLRFLTFENFSLHWKMSFFLLLTKKNAKDLIYFFYVENNLPLPSKVIYLKNGCCGIDKADRLETDFTHKMIRIQVDSSVLSINERDSIPSQLSCKR